MLDGVQARGKGDYFYRDSVSSNHSLIIFGNQIRALSCKYSQFKPGSQIEKDPQYSCVRGSELAPTHRLPISIQEGRFWALISHTAAKPSQKTPQPLISPEMTSSQLLIGCADFEAMWLPFPFPSPALMDPNGIVCSENRCFGGSPVSQATDRVDAVM